MWHLPGVGVVLAEGDAPLVVGGCAAGRWWTRSWSLVDMPLVVGDMVLAEGDMALAEGDGDTALAEGDASPKVRPCSCPYAGSGSGSGSEAGEEDRDLRLRRRMRHRAATFLTLNKICRL